MDKPMQNTIKEAIEVSGIGLHTGEEVKAIFKPAPCDTGIVFIKDNVSIEALISYVSSSYREISLKKDGICIRTIEHLLAALSSLSITNLFIELKGPEVPIMDGSSFPFVELIKKVGIRQQNRKIKYVSIVSPLEIKENGRSISVLPYNGLKVSYTISFNHPIQSQSLEIVLNEETFTNEIAKARTFGFMDEVSHLRQKGLIKGGSLENAVVIEDNKIINKEPLRYPDEFVRHKILDLLGDISLLKWKLKGHIIANCSGHSLNIKLARRINEMIERKEGVILEGEGMDIREILDVIPHRYPFLLVDRVVEMEKGKRVVGIKNVTINENFFQGHFPGNPVMPGVLIIEAMAQTAGVLLLAEEENRGKLVYLAGCDNVRFKKPVIPGDQVRFEVVPIKIRKKVGMVEGKAYIDKELVASATLLFSFG